MSRYDENKEMRDKEYYQLTTESYMKQMKVLFANGRPFVDIPKDMIDVELFMSSYQNHLECPVYVAEDEGFIYITRCDFIEDAYMNGVPSMPIKEDKKDE